jgi:hypothetical protein
MRAIVLLLLALALAACCRCPERSPEPPAEALGAPPAVTPLAVTAEVTAPEEAPVAAAPLLPEVVAGEGDVLCRKDGDVRTVSIHMLENGRCLLVYNNNLSGNGTENTLVNRAACELQQQRMKKNFANSGFRCE